MTNAAADTLPVRALPQTAKPAIADIRPAKGFLRRIPVLGRLAREIDEDINNIFWLLPVIILGLVLGVQTWGLVALTMVALLLVPLMFAFFIAISWPWP